MKWIISGLITVVAGLFFYGVFTAKYQIKEGVSLFKVASTYQDMNPVSQYGYRWVMKNDSVINDAAIKVNQVLDDLTAQ